MTRSPITFGKQQINDHSNQENRDPKPWVFHLSFSSVLFFFQAVYFPKQAWNDVLRSVTHLWVSPFPKCTSIPLQKRKQCFQTKTASIRFGIQTIPKCQLKLTRLLNLPLHILETSFQDEKPSTMYAFWQRSHSSTAVNTLNLRLPFPSEILKSPLDRATETSLTHPHRYGGSSYSSSCFGGYELLFTLCDI